MLKKTLRSQSDIQQLGGIEQFRPLRGLTAFPFLHLDDLLIRPNNGLGLQHCSSRILIFYIVDGVLTHGDSLNHHCILHEGDAFCLDAADGVRHSELNHHIDPLRLIRITLQPRVPSRLPQYVQGHFFKESSRGHWQQLAGACRDPQIHVLPIHADVSVFTCMLDADGSIDYVPSSGRQALLYAISGTCEANGLILQRGDSLHFFAEALEIRTFSDCRFLLLDIPLFL